MTTTSKGCGDQTSSQPGTVLIVSDDAECSRRVMQAWDLEREKPAFTQMGGDLCTHPACDDFDVAVVIGVDTAHLDAVISSLTAGGKPLILVSESGAQRMHEQTFVRLARTEGWPEALKAVVSETLMRVQAQAQARQAEQALGSLNDLAALGRYMLETRHTLNNALTSVLGNAELLLLDGALDENATAQVETIRTMAVRIHETLQRFTSLQKELNAVAAQQQRQARAKAQAAAT